MPDGAVSEDEKLWGAGAYFLGLILSLVTGGLASLLGPVITYAVKKESRFVRFHSIQSLIFSLITTVIMLGLGIALTVVAIATFGVGALLGLLLIPLALVFAIIYVYAGYKAYKGEWYKIPGLGGFSEKQSEKSFL